MHGSARSRSTGVSAGGGVGTVVLSRTEYLGSVTATNIALQPGKTGGSQVDAMAGIFEQYRWDALAFKCKPTVGTSADGSAFIGYSYEGDHYPKTKTQIASCAPSDSFPVSKERTLTAPVKQLMNSTWLSTKATSGDGNQNEEVAGYFNIYADKAVDLWFSYTVTFSGPTSMPRKPDVTYAFDTTTSRWTFYDSEDKSSTVANSVPAQGSLDLDIEIGSSTASAIDTVVAGLQKLYTSYQQVHRFTATGATMIHAVATGINVLRLLVPTVPVMIHQRQLPFRPTAGFLRLASDRGIAATISGDYRLVESGEGTHSTVGSDCCFVLSDH